MKRYNDKYVPNTCGFHNTGVICYLNTMMQALMSCSAFNQHLLENKEKFMAAALNGNKIGLLYVKLLEENGLSVSPNGRVSKEAVSEIKQCNASALLRELIDLRKRENKRTLLHHQQEGFHEGLTFLIEALTDADPTVADLFNIRYKMDIECRSCKNVKEGPQEKPNLMFHLFEEDPILQDALDSKTKIEEYIRRHVNIPEDYKCEKCKAINKVETILNPDGSQTKKIAPHVRQYYRLARISSIIILVFNKYDEKKYKFFPESLDFESKTGNLHYELVSQVEHYGTKFGGHYLTKCRRPTNEGFKVFVKSKHDAANKSELHTLKTNKSLLVEKIKTYETHNREVNPSLVKQLQQIESRIAELNVDTDFGDNIVFHLNDSSVSVDPNGFRPTNNTYVAIYHLA
jgi:ubiquitin C-terminal hydrolase